MLLNIFISLTLFLIHITNSQRFVGDVCTSDSGSTGICKLFEHCESARIALKQNNEFPKTCGFSGSDPIICCVDQGPVSEKVIEEVSTRPKRVPGVISKRKCREYSRYVYESKPQPINIINASSVTRNECGHKVVKLIVGGEPAGRKEFPHMAAIGFEPTPNEISYHCGGTILSKHFILTAAHCLSDHTQGDAKWVKLGVVWLNDTKHVQVIAVAERIAHPEYKSSSHYEDIGLIKLQRPARLNSFARPACLYFAPEVSTEKAIATGWGQTAYAGSQSVYLQKVTLDLFDHNFCNRSYKNQISRKLKRGIVNDIQLCAGSLDEEKDTCQGDSGGPLQIYHIGDEVKCMYDIVGVTSFGKACSGSPGVYARVSHYLQWIEDVVWP